MSAIGSAIWDRIVNEPVLILAVVQAGLGLGISFGLHWSGEQVGAVMAFSAAVLGFIARRQVTPVARLPEGSLRDTLGSSG